VECASITDTSNNCAVVGGKLSLFTEDGGANAAIDEVDAALKEAINDGQFNDAHEGIVRVTYAEEQTPNEGVQEDITDSEKNTVSPANDESDFLTLGLSLSAAGLVLIAVGASIYKRKKHLRENDASTLQEGATLNGLSRFDAPTNEAAHRDESFLDGDGTDTRELDVIPLSPAANRLCDNDTKATAE
jgi:hypothetical protein